MRSTVAGDIDLNGALGLDRHVRNGYKLITVRLAVEGDAPAEQLRELVEQARARSVLIDILAATVPVVIETETV